MDVERNKTYQNDLYRYDCTSLRTAMAIIITNHILQLVKLSLYPGDREYIDPVMG